MWSLGATHAYIYICFALTRRDRPSGDAYVELEEEQDIKEAVKQHKQNMGSRYKAQARFSWFKKDQITSIFDIYKKIFPYLMCCTYKDFPMGRYKSLEFNYQNQDYFHRFFNSSFRPVPLGEFTKIRAGSSRHALSLSWPSFPIPTHLHVNLQIFSMEVCGGVWGEWQGCGQGQGPRNCARSA